MSTRPVLRLDPARIINKGIMTRDKVPHHSIVGTTEDSIIVIDSYVRIRKYVIPKSLIVDYDGSYVHLSITESELEKYREK